MAEAALVLAPLDVLEHEVQEALALCGGDPMKALRITLIANAFGNVPIDVEVGEQALPALSR